MKEDIRPEIVADAVRRELQADRPCRAIAILSRLSVGQLRSVLGLCGIGRHTTPKSAILAELPTLLAHQTASGARYIRYLRALEDAERKMEWTAERIRRHRSQDDPPRLGCGRPVTGAIILMGGWRNPHWANRGYTEAEEHQANLDEIRAIAARARALPAVPDPLGSDGAERVLSRLLERATLALSQAEDAA